MDDRNVFFGDHTVVNRLGVVVTVIDRNEGHEPRVIRREHCLSVEQARGEFARLANVLDRWAMRSFYGQARE
jgi:hypothetical protein